MSTNLDSGAASHLMYANNNGTDHDQFVLDENELMDFDNLIQEQIHLDEAQQPQDSPAIVPAVTATASSPLVLPPHPTTRSQARAIPGAKMPPTHQGIPQNQTTFSLPSSQESAGSAFLSGLLNPSAAGHHHNINNFQQLSHTPPTALGTSYENSHFGKRARSGSISGRLRSASDLEEKGLIDRQQKGILKDLIICGDEDLQIALDKYEDGDPSALEHMIRSGALQSKHLPDLDLLGDLDLDFLTVNDIDGTSDGYVDSAGGEAGMYKLPEQQQQTQQGHTKIEASHFTRSRAAPAPSATVTFPGLGPPPILPTKQRIKGVKHTTATSGASPSMVSPVYDDGIGELDFTGDFGGESDDLYAVAAADAQHQQFISDHAGNGYRAMSPATSIDEDKRLRSNSLFSALINEPHTHEAHGPQYGGWMDHVPKHASASKPIQIPGRQTQSEGEYPASEQSAVEKGESKARLPPSERKITRRKSDSAAIQAQRKLKKILKEEAKEQKRQEKQEKREQREREKLEKKEARIQAKAEKKKTKSEMETEEEKPIHIPGSGLPRSMSDPNLRTSIDEFGLVQVDRPDGWVGAYSPESRKVRIDKFLAKRHQRVWTKTVKYDVRKNFADSRLRVKGRFVKKEDELLMRELMSLT